SAPTQVRGHTLCDQVLQMLAKLQDACGLMPIGCLANLHSQVFGHTGAFPSTLERISFRSDAQTALDQCLNERVIALDLRSAVRGIRLRRRVFGSEDRSYGHDHEQPGKPAFHDLSFASRPKR